MEGRKGGICVVRLEAGEVGRSQAEMLLDKSKFTF